MKTTKQRFTFRCWNCHKTYTLYREITKEQQLLVACPFCEKEAVVELAPFKREIKSTLKKVTLRGDGDDGESAGFEYDFPDELPTEERKEAE